MMKPSQDLTSHVVPKRANGSQTSANVPILTIAAATEDNVKVTGLTIDRSQGNALAESLILALTYNATLTNAKTLSFAVEYQEANVVGTWTTATAIQALTVAATGDGVATEFYGTEEFAMNLRGVATAVAAASLGYRYIRFNITPDLSHSSADEAAWEAIAILGGFEQAPK